MNSHRFCMSQKVFITLTLKDNFTLYRIMEQWSSFTSFSPCLPNILWEFHYNAYPCIPCSSINKPAHILLSKFFLSLVYWSFHIICPSLFTGIYFTWFCSLRFIHQGFGLVPVISFVKFSVIITSNIFYVLFSPCSLSGVLITYKLYLLI